MSYDHRNPIAVRIATVLKEHTRLIDNPRHMPLGGTVNDVALIEVMKRLGRAPGKTVDGLSPEEAQIEWVEEVLKGDL